MACTHDTGWWPGTMILLGSPEVPRAGHGSDSLAFL